MFRVVVAFLFAAFASLASAYTLTGQKWASTPITMHLQLGTASYSLMDGAASWGAVAEDALNTWNDLMASQRFAVVRDSGAPKAQGNRANNVFFSNDVYGDVWGSGVLAVTLSYYSASSMTESDVLFNNNLSWNSYRGALRPASGGGTLLDFRRVALHEFGHVLGLNHPDQAGQTVTAVMNSRISNLDALAADDITGVQAIYGAPVVNLPPQITMQPQNIAAFAGSTQNFAVSASGTAPLAFQWFKNGAAIPGATGSTLNFASVTYADAGTYRVTVSNRAGTATSSDATLVVNAPIAPPSITTPPASQTAPAGATVTFSVNATGGGTLLYAWYRDGSPLGAPSEVAILTLTNVQPAQAGSYTVRVSNLTGSVTSAPATLTVNAPPTITGVGGGGTFAVGARVALNVGVSSTLPVTRYEWAKDGVVLANATTATLTFAAAQVSDSGMYSVTVTTAAGTATSSTRVVIGTPVAITKQPQSQTIPVGQPIYLTVEVSNPSAPGLRYTWGKEGEFWGPTTNLDYTQATLVIPTAVPANAGTYHVSIETPLGVVQSASAVITIVPAVTPPRIVELTPSQTIGLGQGLTLTVNATGALNYQWRHNGVDIPGADGPYASSCWIRSASADTAGDYTVVLTNTAGTTVSAPITVTMNYSRLANLSARAYVPPGGALTPGFVIHDYQTAKDMVIRGIGPSLGAFGVNAPVPDTKLELIASSSPQPMEANNDWGGTMPLRTAFASVGAFALATDSRDAAIDRLLLAGAYTVRVTATEAAASGIALAEVYDRAPLTATTRLVNLSARALAGPGEKVLTAGFVIAGNMPKRVLIRAIGPGLAAFGVTAPLADPQLKVIPAGADAPLAANDDWGGTAELKTTFAAAGAFALAEGSRDAALVVSLPPGSYTVLVSGANDASGEALVEVYDLDP